MKGVQFPPLTLPKKLVLKRTEQCTFLLEEGCVTKESLEMELFGSFALLREMPE